VWGWVATPVATPTVGRPLNDVVGDAVPDVDVGGLANTNWSNVHIENNSLGETEHNGSHDVGSQSGNNGLDSGSHALGENGDYGNQDRKQLAGDEGGSMVSRFPTLSRARPSRPTHSPRSKQTRPTRPVSEAMAVNKARDENTGSDENTDANKPLDMVVGATQNNSNAKPPKTRGRIYPDGRVLC